jgi:hypothetical protein
MLSTLFGTTQLLVKLEKTSMKGHSSGNAYIPFHALFRLWMLLHVERVS